MAQSCLDPPSRFISGENEVQYVQAQSGLEWPQDVTLLPHPHTPNCFFPRDSVHRLGSGVSVLPDCPMGQWSFHGEGAPSVLAASPRH